MYLLILGGSLDHPGGVEAFSDRSREALERNYKIRVRRIPTSTAYLTFKKFPNYLRGIFGLISCLRDRPDCVWLQYVNLPDLSYLLLARLLGFRVMVTPHLGSNWRSQSSPVLRKLSKGILSLAHRLALISKTQELEIDLPDSVPRSLIRNFLPVEILTAPLPDSSQRPPAIQLIHSGRLSEGKGSFLVIEVAARLRDAGYPFFFRITGGADEATYAKMRQMISQYKLEEHVAILGRVPEEDLLNHLRGSDLLVHLSKIDSYPLIVLEAMACSMLTVCMELAGARNMVETYGGHIVSQLNPVEETADWIMSQSLDTLRQNARVAALNVRTDYSWDNCAHALDNALKECVISKPSPVLVSPSS